MVSDPLAMKVDQIKESLKDAIKNEFDSHNISYDGNAMRSFEGALEAFLDVSSKWLPPQKYNVNISAKLQNDMDIQTMPQSQEISVQDIVACIQKFKEDFENGEDMNCHLSTNICRSNNKDLLLNAINIRHMHLNSDTGKKNRSPIYLMIAVRDNNVYFLDTWLHPAIGDHFFAFEVLDILVDNDWQNIIGGISCYDVVGFEDSFPKTHEEAWYLLQNGINLSGYCHNGKCIMFPKGIVCDKNDRISVNNLQEQLRIVACIERIAKGNDFDSVNALLSCKNGTLSLELESDTGKRLVMKLK